MDSQELVPGDSILVLQDQHHPTEARVGSNVGQRLLRIGGCLLSRPKGPRPGCL